MAGIGYAMGTYHGLYLPLIRGYLDYTVEIWYNIMDYVILDFLISLCFMIVISISNESKGGYEGF